ncbi:hypothetical protein [Leisingera caerulea]|uniref:hypothetical protein n=1 Tax=Leisingera caerulea TaxID=506591 RepID=UPI00040CC312|nr:hypothetical protein [Leisingera caerulea]
MKSHLFLLLTVTAALSAAPALCGEGRYLGVIIGSEHFGNDSLNDFNPGLTLGKRWDARWDSGEYHVEGGVFYNSYEEASPLLLAGVSTRLVRAGRGEIRVGASAGIAYYDELSGSLKDRYGLPSVGGFIPVAVLGASYRISPVEIRLTTLPPDTDTEAVLNLSIAFDF